MDHSTSTIEDILKKQRLFFATHQTKDVKFRMRQLRLLKENIIKHEKLITAALWNDLHKSYEEAYLTEISVVLLEIEYHLKNMSQWAKPKKVRTPLHLLPSRSRVISEPLGVALIIAPWNYPFQLLMNPLVGAISAGCCAILKPSPYTPNISKVMNALIQETFNSNYIDLIEGHREVNEILLEQRFDIIFFTGSAAVGRVVMRKAAEHLTPVILELGGKSPCIVDADANLEIAAKRIAWGKTINAGQTCIAPDYLFVHASVKEELIKKMITHFKEMYGEDIQQSHYFARIVNQQAFQRLQRLLELGRIRFGEKVDANDRYISPTLLDEIEVEFPIMKEEIFGPILPILTYTHLDEVITYVNHNEKPLAFYYFGNNKQAKEIIARTTSGGVCVNDTLMHITNHYLPFGGVGNSGSGKYHGYHSFMAFSNMRGVLNSLTWIDLPLKYAPFKYFKLIKKLL